uniref:Uncharacterized protein n=1 Tax=Lactuca sativa TaxID=4236 RepID=A0A9R1VD27_LACSA|nr:hypothetical protein LSAT_V11C500267270 [Lactuca sativa]
MFGFKNFLWHGGSAYDAWFSCVSNQGGLTVSFWCVFVPLAIAMFHMVKGLINSEFLVCFSPLAIAMFHMVKGSLVNLKLFQGR